MTDRQGDPAPLRFTVNGTERVASASSEARLSDLLRLELGLTGTKIGCDAGDCGACTVLLEDRQVCACLVPASQTDGRAVLTVEGLGTDPIGRRLQAAFHAHGAAQCGICTPGMLMAARDLLAGNPAPDRRQIEEALGGVLCRCTGYLKIIEAVAAVAAGTSLTQVDTDPTTSNGSIGSRYRSSTDCRGSTDRRSMGPMQRRPTRSGSVSSGRRMRGRVSRWET